MKVILVAIISFFFIGAQAQGINFQGVARSANGTIIAASNISLRLSIIAKSVDATPEYVETKTVMTNTQGIFSIVVGDASNNTITGNFKNINWADAPKFLKVEMDPAGGTNYISMGATQLQYVPYSFYSLGVAASNVNGILPLAKGGTGVGTIGELKTALGNYGNVDSIGNIKVGNNVLAKTQKTPATFFTSMNKNNVNIGIGDSALFSNTIGAYNVAIGNKSLSYNRVGGFNTAVGYGAMLDMGNDTSTWQGWANTAVGSTALMRNRNGSGNIAMGSGTLELGTTGNMNSGYGMDALHFANGDNNTGIGDSALSYLNTGNNNTGLGYRSGLGLINGSNNIFIGNSVGANSSFANVSNILAIDNKDTTKPLIYGEFDNKRVTINGGLIANSFKVPGGTSAQYLRADGTVTTSVTSGVPYTGASQAVDLGTYDMKVNGLTIGIGAGTASATANTAVGKGTLRINTSGGSNTALGANTLYNNTTGGLNTSIGAFSMMSNTIGNGNTALGHFSLIQNVSGNDNTAIGNSALSFNTTGSNNTATGLTALSKNTTGSNNTAMGNSSLFSNTTGNFNTAYGSLSMQNNTTGYENIAIGGEALRENTTGNFSVAVGTAALVNNTLGDENSAIGRRAMNNNTTGSFNTAIGQAALYANTTGSNNTAVGRTSLVYNTGESNTAVGATSITNNTTGFNNTGVGYYALGTNTTGMNNVAIGHNANVAASNLNNAIAIGAGAIVSASNSIQLGNSSITDVKTSGLITSGKGFLAQGITAATRDAIVSPEAGFIIFCKDCGDNGEVEVFNGNSWTNMAGTSPATVNTVLTGLNNGLLSYYQFNGNLTDVSGFTNAGTSSSTVGYNLDRFSQSAKSASLSTNNDIIATTNQFNNPQTIAYSFWFKTSQVGQFVGFNNGQYTHGGNWDRVISLDANGYITFYIFNGNERFLRGNVNLKDNTWHHCAVNFSSAGTVVYIDGSVAAQDNTFNLSQNYIGYYRIGGLQTGATNSSLSSNTGSIDDVRIYNRILTTNEINYLRTH